MNEKNLPATTVSTLYEQGKLHFEKGIYNIIDCGCRTGKTYWAVHNLKDLTRDNNLNRILFLVNTTTLKDQIVHDYADLCVNADDYWERNAAHWGDYENKIGVMCYQRLGAKIMKREMSFLDEIDVICWDECDSIFDFAVNAFADARKTDFARDDISNAEILTVIQTYSTKKDYMPLILLGVWEEIIKQSTIYCIGLSATPERAIQYYHALTAASNQGKIDAGFRMDSIVYFNNIIDHISRLTPMPGKGYWCYSPYIEPNKGIVAAARERGFNAIEIHSPNNSDKPLTEEQKRVYRIISETHMVPYEYDFIVINAIAKTGISIDDERFDHVIVNDLKLDSRTQAARQTFPYSLHLKSWIPEVPAQYLNKWLTVTECRQLAEELQVCDPNANNKNSSHILTWNSLKDQLPRAGYTIQSARKRLNGKQQMCYYIKGEWQDSLPEDGWFNLLAAAREEQQQAALE